MNYKWHVMASSSNVSIDESDNDTTVNSVNGFASETAVDRYGFIGNKITIKFVYFNYNNFYNFFYH